MEYNIENIEDFISQIGIKKEDEHEYGLFFHKRNIDYNNGKFDKSYCRHQMNTDRPHKRQYQITFINNINDKNVFVYLGIFKYEKDEWVEINTSLKKKIQISFEKNLPDCGFSSGSTPYKDLDKQDEIKYYKISSFNENIDNLIDYDENGEIKDVKDDENNDDGEKSINNDTKQDNFSLNQILYGPPGTGKTYNTIIYSIAIIEGKDIDEIKKEDYKEVHKRFEKYYNQKQIVFITFHQSYSYEEFVEGIKPELNNNKSDNISYICESGIFKVICNEVGDKNNKDKKYVLIIDEINRGNISKIFGELITLIEEKKREGEEEQLKVQLPYSKETFTVPNNLYIIGTMNTADRSIATIDIALRRRFKFIEMMPDSDMIKDINISGINLKELMDNLNKGISILIDRDHQIGHSYFMNIKTLDDLKNVWFDKIIPLLNEYFYGDWDKLNKIIEPFIKEESIPEDLKDEYSEGKLYSFKNKKECNENEFLEDLKRLFKK